MKTFADYLRSAPAIRKFWLRIDEGDCHSHGLTFTAFVVLGKEVLPSLEELDLFGHQCKPKTLCQIVKRAERHATDRAPATLSGQTTRSQGNDERLRLLLGIHRDVEVGIDTWCNGNGGLTL